ncbi:hypothetical protein [Embleya sp. AB8]|uniref:hypothetical protein n=1 Tax=Embleya sp. AB8 TaxID=3156304 RepID=UPI003C72CB02
MTTGDVTASWCPTCKAHSLLGGEVLVLAPDGVARVSSWRWCEICENPAYPEQEKCCGP